MADVWANSMACHPRATCHIAVCCHLANSMNVIPEDRVRARCRLGLYRRRLMPLGEFTVVIPEPIATLQGCHLAKSMSWTCHIAECKNSIRHIKNRFSPYFSFFVFNAFRLWRAVAFISSPIHFFHLQQYYCTTFPCWSHSKIYTVRNVFKL